MGATPLEEITKQHLAAATLIESELPCATRIHRGEIPLCWKSKPTYPHPHVEESEESNVNERNHFQEPSDANLDSPGDFITNESVEVDVTYLEWCISTRGEVDVTPIVKLVTEGVNDPAPVPVNNEGKTGKKTGIKKSSALKSKVLKTPAKLFSRTNLWNELNASTHNVKITRPSHDAWGIKKIILVFCDDFLNSIYTLPWYQTGDEPTEEESIGNKMHSAIQPILDLLNISQNQMVRCLLAALPPGVTIPVHHDTGEWVKFTHRVHVPIIVPDPSKVLFRCGPTEQSMERVDCTPGHVFEMNNQAKHAVTNAGNLFRVHLILDYVDHSFFKARALQNCPVRRVTLSPGEVITQTRRSIDRALESGTRQQPSFVILGAQKAGTTSLYEYMSQHPWIVKAKRRETHCLDWRWNDTLQSTEQRRAHCMQFYHAEAMKPYPSLRTGDSTPSYLLDYYRVIPRLKECFCPEPKLIVLVRDPIKRAASHYAMVTSSDGTPEQMMARGVEWRGKSFVEVLEQDVNNMRADGLLPYWDPEKKIVDKTVFDSFVNSREEDEAWERYVRTRVPLNTGSYSPIARGLYALQCRQWFRSFSRDKFLVLKLEDMSADDKGVQWVVNKSLEHLGLPQFEISDIGKKNTREYVDPTDGKEELKEWLGRFFAPHNKRFCKMMVEEMCSDESDWSDLWT